MAMNNDILIFAPPKKYISYKHLYVGESKDDVIYIGYPFKVTKREYEILRLLLENRKKPICASNLAALMWGEIAEKNVIYHISNINKKSKMLGNRELIKNKAKIGYFLNEEM